MNIGESVSLFINNFQRTQTTTLAASLAFYTSLSLAPILIIFVTISAHLDNHLQEIFLSQVAGVIGKDTSLIFKLIFENAKLRPDLSSMSGLGGIVTLMFSSGLIFGEMRDALNDIFRAQPESLIENSWWMTAWDYAKTRFFQTGLAFGFILLMIASLGITAFISATTLFLDDIHFISALNIVISGLLYFGLYTLLFRFVPRRHLPWKQSYEGGAITAFLFLFGKEFIGIYLGNSAIGSAYGAAGSLVVLLIWVYYSALIVLIGAHISFLLNEKDPSNDQKMA